jgi:hypothetical protein
MEMLKRLYKLLLHIVQVITSTSLLARVCLTVKKTTPH